MKKTKNRIEGQPHRERKFKDRIYYLDEKMNGRKRKLLCVKQVFCFFLHQFLKKKSYYSFLFLQRKKEACLFLNNDFNQIDPVCDLRLFLRLSHANVSLTF